MWNRAFRLATLIAMATALAACSESITTPFESGPEIAAPATADLEGAIDLAAINGRAEDLTLFDRLSVDIPGFGGFWFDRRCNLNVILTDLGQTERARQVLAPYLRRYVETHRCPDSATIIVHSGEYTWEELKTWLRKLEPATGFRGVARLGIAVPLNRIVVAVEGRPAAAEVLRLAESVDVPTRAIKFVLASSDSDRQPTDRRTRSS